MEKSELAEVWGEFQAAGIMNGKVQGQERVWRVQ